MAEDQVETIEDQATEEVEVKDEAPSIDDAVAALSPEEEKAAEEPAEGEGEVAEGETEEGEKHESSVIKAIRQSQREASKKARELERELREAREKLNAYEKPKELELGEKPTLEKFDYDAGKFETALADYYERKRKVDESESAKKAEADKAAKDWQARLDAYQSGKGALGVEDIEETEAVVTDLLDVTQQGIIVHGAKNAALLMYALGKNEVTARGLAAIKDPVQFAIAVGKIEAKLEGTLTTGKKKPAVAPEGRVSGSSGSPVGGDSTLNRLRAEAERTGDRSKVVAHMRAQRNKQRG